MRKHSWLAIAAGLPLLAAGLLPAAGVSAAAPIQVIVDGRTLALDPVPAIVNDRTLVPVRGLLEAMGATVTWTQETKTVEVNKGDHYVRLRIGRQLACLATDCSSAATLDVPAQLIGDRTYLPARFISRRLAPELRGTPTAGRS